MNSTTEPARGIGAPQSPALPRGVWEWLRVFGPGGQFQQLDFHSGRR
jgi:hypothetical protein